MEKNIQDLIQEKIPFFSKGQKRICTYITEECEKAAFMTAANLGKAVGVSESTVVRFAMELGYGGYPGMQNALRQMMIIRVKEPGNTQKNSEGRSNEKSLSAFLREEAENIYQSAEILEEKTCEAMCNSLKECRSVYLLGLSQVAPFVEYMKSYMRLLHPNVQTITTSHRREIVEQLSFADKMDTALLLGFPSDNEDILFMAQLLKSKGVTTIVISDSKLSPVAQFGDYSVVAKTKKSFFGESMAAPISIIHGILSILFEGDRPLVKERMEKCGHLLEHNFSEEKR